MKDLRKHGLTPDLISGLQKGLYWSLVSTCYIVANLASLRPPGGDLAGRIGYSEQTLFATLFRSPYKLEALFPESYHQIMLTARSLIAFAAVTGDDVARSTLPALLQELVARDRSRVLDEKAEERRRLQRVVKEWLTIDWEDDDQERLGGGYLIRFDLAKARSLLKVADLRARVGLRNVGRDPVSDRNAQQIMSEVGGILRDAYALLGQARQKAQAAR